MRYQGNYKILFTDDVISVLPDCHWNCVLLRGFIYFFHQLGSLYRIVTWIAIGLRAMQTNDRSVGLRTMRTNDWESPLHEPRA